MTVADLPLAGTREATMHERRWCEKCESVCEGGLPDPCLGEIPGVSHACCGHGVTEPYVVLGGEPNQNCTTIPRIVTLRGERAATFFTAIRGHLVRRFGDLSQELVGAWPARKTRPKEGRMGSIEETAERIVRKGLLKKTPLTAGQIAERIGAPSGRSIAKPLGRVVNEGLAIQHAGKRPTYTKAAV